MSSASSAERGVELDDIAIAIATRLGFPAHQVKGIGLAATIHDVGKVAVPAETPSRSTALSAPEMALVRTHAEAGYAILRDIDFPWPVAEMVRQHHERLDGPGTRPRGLRGDTAAVGACVALYRDGTLIDPCPPVLRRQAEPTESVAAPA